MYVKLFQLYIKNIFPDIKNNIKNNDWLRERAILAPTNDSVHIINEIILNDLPGDITTYLSFDTATDESESVHYPVEFLNSQNPPGIPPHKLLLKIGSPIILLRNIDAPKLCNGTRLKVKLLMPHVIEATILTGCAKGEDVFIPRIPLITTDLPFEFKRVQFPVKLAFGITINKAQGQSLKVAGIDLSNDCFGHGQLYVAFSRVGSSKNLFILAENSKTNNVVFKEIL